MKRSNRTKISATQLINDFFATDDLMATHGTDDPVEILAKVDIEQLGGQSRDFDGFEDEDAEFKEIVLWAKETKKKLEKKRDAGSLEFLVEKIGKTSRQVREYCKKGLVPGAYQTEGGHWKVCYTEDTIEKLRSNIGYFSRQRSESWLVRRLRKRHEDGTESVPSYPEELCSPYEVIKNMNLMQYEVFAAAKSLIARGKTIKYSVLASMTGYSRGTLRKYFPSLRKVAHAGHGGSPLIDQMNDEINKRNGKVFTQNVKRPHT
jgi:hypothetical protein